MSTFSGHLRLEAAARAGGRTALAAQSFRAPYHLSKPYWDGAAETLLVQVVNPTAGILEGDFLESDIAVGKGAALLVTTPSASRVFKMRDGSAACRQHFKVAKGGWLEVLPEPLVPHRGCRYRQATRVEVAAGGGLFFVDLMMPGRIAHRGEAWGWDRLCLETEVRWAGELILRERFDTGGAELKALAALTGSGPKACFGNAVLVAEGEAGWLPAVAALHGDGVWLGVSALRRAGWSIKFVAADSIRLRKILKQLRGILAVYFPRMACDPRKL
jgi:urease accessory protein